MFSFLFVSAAVNCFLCLFGFGGSGMILNECNLMQFLIENLFIVPKHHLDQIYREQKPLEKKNHFLPHYHPPHISNTNYQKRLATFFIAERTSQLTNTLIHTHIKQKKKTKNQKLQTLEIQFKSA